MKCWEACCAGLMLMGLVLGAMTGAIVLLVLPVLAGVILAEAASWHKRDHHIKVVQYPSYKY